MKQVRPTLNKLGVIGTPAELQQASHDFAGHALALTLLGTYLVKVHRGEVRKRDLIPHLTDERKQGAHAQRVLASYEHWLSGKPELDILRLMGLFDRPASAGAIAALRKEPAIEGLTDQLQSVNDIDWEYAVSNLRDLRLLSNDSDDVLDCHPLLREHFGEQLRTTNDKAFREAHRRLYEYYKSAAKELPDTLEEMAPLFAAVAHGCLAGQHQAALMMCTGSEFDEAMKHYSSKKLGAFGSDLAALSGFFDPPWRQPVAALREERSKALSSTKRALICAPWAAWPRPPSRCRRVWKRILRKRTGSNAAISCQQPQRTLPDAGRCAPGADLRPTERGPGRPQRRCLSAHESIAPRWPMPYTRRAACPKPRPPSARRRRCRSSFSPRSRSSTLCEAFATATCC